MPTPAAKVFTDKLQQIWAPFQKCLLTLTNASNEVDPQVVAAAIKQAESNDADYIKISDGLAQRLAGLRARWCSPLGEAIMRSLVSVAKKPGASAFDVTPVAPYSAARARAIDVSPALAVA